jgi:hypothetical protein
VKCRSFGFHPTDEDPLAPRPIKLAAGPQPVPLRMTPAGGWFVVIGGFLVLREIEQDYVGALLGALEDHFAAVWGDVEFADVKAGGEGG